MKVTVVADKEKRLAELQAEIDKIDRALEAVDPKDPEATIVTVGEALKADFDPASLDDELTAEVALRRGTLDMEDAAKVRSNRVGYGLMVLGIVFFTLVGLAMLLPMLGG